jgi:hypothetical protein
MSTGSSTSTPVVKDDGGTAEGQKRTKPLIKPPAPKGPRQRLITPLPQDYPDWGWG